MQRQEKKNKKIFMIIVAKNLKIIYNAPEKTAALAFIKKRIKTQNVRAVNGGGKHTPPLNSMQIDYVDISTIKPYPKNAKKHDKKQIAQVAESIKSFGWVQPLVVDKSNELVIGHCRLDAAKKLGQDKVPVLKKENLTDAQIKALRLADNKLNESAWSMDLVIEELKGLDPVNLELTGFEFALIENNIGWNPDKFDDIGDGINELVGYGLQSFWKDIKNENSELFKYWIELPLQQKSNLVRQKYSRTNLEELRRVIKTYMRTGDYFLENCCGWSSFSCSAVLHGFSGVGVDIWDTALEHSRKQYDLIKHLENVGKYEVLDADGMQLPFKDKEFDFVYCNPPFMDQEKYSGKNNDIASSNDTEFANKFKKLQSENYRVLKNGCLCVITINDFRRKGTLESLHSKIIDLSLSVGFKLWDFVVAEVESQKIRLRKKDYKLKRTVKCHEYVIVFVKD